MPETATRYGLRPSQVPDFPRSGRFVDELRWCIAVMNEDDDDLAFAASLLKFAAERGGLTEKQERYGRRLIDRVRALWQGSALNCQRQVRGREAESPTLEAMTPAGRA